LAPGDFIALFGDLGTGKTCFTRGVAVGLEVSAEDYVTSPTYTLMNSYRGRLLLHHYDLYRVAEGEVSELGLDENFFGSSVCLVEWAERLGEEIPEDRLSIYLYHEENDVRRLEFVPAGVRWEIIVNELCAETG
jgi:tRNA threonylcarbamoyladenosine biosynthesis protein TsaE